MNESDDIKLAKILVVDDEELNLVLLEELFSMEDYSNVTFVDDPLKGVECCKEESFDLILLDLKMPNMDGFEFLKTIQTQLTSCPPVLVLTASADKATEEKVIKANAQGVISKPFDHEEVLCTIKDLVGQYWRKSA